MVKPILFPGALTVEFDGNDPGTQTRMNWVRQARGWQPGEFNVNMSLDEGELVITGKDKDALPKGTYWVQMFIQDVLPIKTVVFSVKADQTDRMVPIPVQTEVRTVNLTVAFDKFDPQIRSVLESPNSRLDGKPVEDWLLAPEPRASRKACLLNLMAALRSTPTAADPLISSVQSIFLGAPDRIYARVDSSMHTRCGAYSTDSNQDFNAEGTPTAAVHRRLLDQAEARGIGKAADYSLWSFRAEGPPSLQVVAAPWKAGNPFCADIDIDLGNPLQDLQGFVTHMGELLGGKLTDHFALWSKLKTRPAKDFLYYTIKK
jgi:hypothetical protein